MTSSHMGNRVNLTRNRIRFQDQSPRFYENYYYNQLGEFDSAYSVYPQNENQDVSITTTVIISLLGCSTAIGIIIVFILLIYIWNRQYHRRMVPVKSSKYNNEHSGKNSQNNSTPFRKSHSRKPLENRGSLADNNGRLVLGGAGLYSKPLALDSFPKNSSSVRRIDSRNHFARV